MRKHIRLPGHYRYLVTRDARYFELFPWWFSPLIMSLYAVFIWFLLSPRPKDEVRA